VDLDSVMEISVVDRLVVVVVIKHLFVDIQLLERIGRTKLKVLKMNMNKGKKLCPICHHYYDKEDMVILRHHDVGWICKSCYKYKKY